MLAQTIQYLYPGIDMLRECIVQDDGDGPRIAQWNRPEPQPTPAEIETARLPAAKAARIVAINAECQTRILARWPLEQQVSAQMGIYGAEQADACRAWIDAHIAASNTASDAVDAAATESAVEAVTVTWPA